MCVNRRAVYPPIGVEGRSRFTDGRLEIEIAGDLTAMPALAHERWSDEEKRRLVAEGFAIRAQQMVKPAA
jgi:hypothetical protein